VPALLAGPTVATAGLALQVPLAVLLDGLLRSPPWLSHAGSTVLTLAGGAVVLCGFFGVNAAGEDDEKTRHSLWEERQEVRPGARGGSANGCPSWLPASRVLGLQPCASYAMRLAPAHKFVPPMPACRRRCSGSWILM
jgi:hypothetical protein